MPPYGYIPIRCAVHAYVTGGGQIRGWDGLRLSRLSMSRSSTVAFTQLAIGHVKSPSGHGGARLRRGQAFVSGCVGRRFVSWAGVVPGRAHADLSDLGQFSGSSGVVRAAAGAKGRAPS